MTTTNLTIIVALVVLLLVVAFVGTIFSSRQRTKKLQERFGPEYNRVIEETGDQTEAEKELGSRLEHVKKIDIRPLSPEQTTQFANDWRRTQARFVDEPLAALQEAERLLKRVMEAKGYPVEDFERNAGDISVDYPDLVPHYRAIHEIASREDAKDIGTEEMRQAIVHCRTLFEKLVGTEVTEESTHQEHVVHKENM
jgi:hypothetical protein